MLAMDRSAPALLSLPSGHEVPALGLGTWRMGERKASHAAELKALRTALDLGYRVFDTAEMYAEGGAEELLGEALAEAQRGGGLAREDLFIVSKVYPHNASAQGVLAACERSRRRLQLDHIDLYLLHWRGAVPLRQTVEGFEWLQQLRLDPPLGREQFRCGRHARTDRGAGWRRLQRQPGVVFAEPARHRVRSAALAAHAADAADGLFARSTRARWPTTQACVTWRRSAACRRRNWHWPGCCRSLA